MNFIRAYLSTGQNGTRAAGLAVKLLLDLILGVTPGEGVGDKNASGSGNAAAAAGRRSGVGGNSNGTGYRRMAPAVERTRGFHFAGCRLMLFLGGAPDRGPGAVMVGVPSAAAVGGDADQDGNGAVHDQLFRGEVKFVEMNRLLGPGARVSVIYGSMMGSLVVMGTSKSMREPVTITRRAMPASIRTLESR